MKKRPVEKVPATATARRQRDIDEFWSAMPYMLQVTGETEEEMLTRFPSMRGTRPPDRAGGARVLSFAVRDGKRAASGDFDDAA